MLTLFPQNTLSVFSYNKSDAIYCELQSSDLSIFNAFATAVSTISAAPVTLQAFYDVSTIKNPTLAEVILY